MQSSAIKSLEYQFVDGRPQLDIVFKSGGVYRYFDVPLSIFNQLVNAESHGKFFQKNIRGNYKFERM